MNASAVGIVLLSYDHAHEKGGLIRSSAHVVEKQEKSVADTGADEHLVALPPNRSAQAIAANRSAGCEPGTHASPGTSGRLLLCLSSFSKSHEHAGTLCTSRLDYD